MATQTIPNRNSQHTPSKIPIPRAPALQDSSKSEGDTMESKKPDSVGLSTSVPLPTMSPPKIVYTEVCGQGEGDILGAYKPSSSKVDVDILYPVSPIKRESTMSVSSAHRKSYLGMYRKRLSTTETVASEVSVGSNLSPAENAFYAHDTDSSNSANNFIPTLNSGISLEWDLNSHQCQEICTQTSEVLTTDQATSHHIIESCSNESLLEDQSKPLILLEQTTEQEESEDPTTDQTEFEEETNTDDELNYLSNSCETVRIIHKGVPVPICSPVEDDVATDTVGLKTESDTQLELPCLKDPNPEEAPLTHGTSNSSILDWKGENFWKASGSTVEIQPSAATLTLDELKQTTNWKSSTGIECNNFNSPGPVKSTMILQSDSAGKLESSFELCNFTAFPQAFKVLMNSVGRDCLKLNLSSGIIPPHGKLSIDITKRDKMNGEAALRHCQICFKMFRSFSNDLKKNNEYYKVLVEEHPELIRTITVDKIIVWKKDDLVEMMNEINSITDLGEREAVKETVYQKLSQTGDLQSTKPSVRQLISGFRMDMHQQHQHLQNLFHEIKFMRHILIFLALLLLCLVAADFAVRTIYAANTAGQMNFKEEEIPPPPPVDEEPPVKEEAVYGLAWFAWGNCKVGVGVWGAGMSCLID